MGARSVGLTWPGWVYRLDDPRDRWLGDDKWAHLFGAAIVAAECGWLRALVAILAVEVFEVVSWYCLTLTQRMLIEDGRLPWPFLHDRVSLKDIAVGFAGMGLPHLLRLLCSLSRFS